MPGNGMAIIEFPSARGRPALVSTRPSTQALIRAAPGRRADRDGADAGRRLTAMSAPAARGRAPLAPPQLLLVVGAISQYAGAGVAVLLFGAVAPATLAWLRVLVAAVALCAWRRPGGRAGRRAGSRSPPRSAS